jgi:hypothetical protein
MSKVPYAGWETARGTTIGRTIGRAQGHSDSSSGNVTIAVRFDPATFARINAEARRLDVSFARVVRDLVDKGLVAAGVAAAPVPRSELAVGDLFDGSGA